MFNKNVRAHFTKKTDAKEASYGSTKLQTAFKNTKHEKHDILVLQCDEYRQNFSFFINFWGNFVVGGSLFFS